MTTKSKKKYPKIKFVVEQLAGCCGIGVVCSFYEDQGEYTGWGVARKPKKKFATRREQAEDCLKRIVNCTWPSKEGDANDNTYGDYYSFLQISLVSNYAVKGMKPQFQELQDVLIENDWTIAGVFINPNHGNEVTLFTKYFPERDKDPYAVLDELDELDNDF